MDNKRCNMCKHFNRYYTKGVTRFNQTEYGWCTRKCESVNIHDYCERYEVRIKARGINRRAKVCLNELLTEISAIRKVIEEEANGVQEE